MVRGRVGIAARLYKDSRREGKEAEGKLWVGGSGPEVPPGDMRAGRLGEGAGDGPAQAACREGLKRGC